MRKLKKMSNIGSAICLGKPWKHFYIICISFSTFNVFNCCAMIFLLIEKKIIPRALNPLMKPANKGRQGDNKLFKQYAI